MLESVLDWNRRGCMVRRGLREVKHFLTDLEYLQSGRKSESRGIRYTRLRDLTFGGNHRRTKELHALEFDDPNRPDLVC